MQDNLSMNNESLLSCAVAAATAAGHHALSNINRRTEIVEDRTHDVKLRLDIECQEVAEGIIQSRFPDHNILGEEDASIRNTKQEANKHADYTWIIDPIDGTVNFSHGFIFWCTSIAVQQNGETVAGAVYAPSLDELYTATTEQEAMCNNKAIHVSNITSLASAMIHTGMDRNFIPGHEPFSIFRAIADNTQKARIVGSAALDMCRVACGQAEGYFESDIYIWDVAAAGLIVRQAGGKAETIRYLEGKHRLQYIATNGLIHDEMRKLLRPLLHI